MPSSRLVRGAGLAAALTLLPAAAAEAAPRVTTAQGATPAAIQPAVDAFRAELGAANPNVAQSFPAGRREVNWDGVLAQFASPNAFLGSFFNVNSPRGIEFTTPGTSTQVSSNAASGVPERFGNVDPSYTTEFATFSAPRLFAPIGSTLTDVNFFIPGSRREATTNGFGVIFTDADREASSSVTFLDDQGATLATVAAPASPDRGLSFVGVSFPDGERIGRVRIRSGQTPIGTGVVDGAATEVAVMDDFIYGEPKAGRADLTDPDVVVAPGATSATLSIRRGGDTSAAASVRVTTQDGTARAGVNYTPVDVRVDFAAGEAVKLVAVPGLRPGTAPTAFTVRLSDPADIALGQGAASTVTLLPAAVAAPPAADRTRPRVTLTRFTSRIARGGSARLVLGTSEDGRARISLSSRGRAVGSAVTRSVRAGATVIRVRAPRALRRGTLTVRVSVTDAAGNRGTASARLNAR